MKPSWIAVVAAATILLFPGCNKPAGAPEQASAPNAEPTAVAEDQDMSPEEKAAVKAVKPFLDALTKRDYSKAYALLSPQAKARFSPNQFSQAEDDAAFASNETKIILNPTEKDFATFMKGIEIDYGTPISVISINVMTMDPTVLAGKGDAMETAFTIGNIPDSVPATVRKASIRSQIGTKLSPADLKKVAEQEGMTVEELEKEEDFAPYFNLKTVLIEENGELKVGYFEFTPPSMFD